MFTFLNRKPTLSDVTDHLGIAEEYKNLHIAALDNAANAAVEHNNHAQNAIDGLASAIATKQEQIGIANAQLSVIQAARAKVA